MKSIRATTQHLVFALPLVAGTARIGCFNIFLSDVVTLTSLFPDLIVSNICVHVGIQMLLFLISKISTIGLPMRYDQRQFAGRGLDPCYPCTPGTPNTKGVRQIGFDAAQTFNVAIGQCICLPPRLHPAGIIKPRDMKALKLINQARLRVEQTVIVKRRAKSKSYRPYRMVTPSADLHY